MDGRTHGHLYSFPGGNWFYSQHIDGNKKNNEKTREEVKSASIMMNSTFWSPQHPKSTITSSYLISFGATKLPDLH